MIYTAKEQAEWGTMLLRLRPLKQSRMRRVPNMAVAISRVEELPLSSTRLGELSSRQLSILTI